MLFLFFLSVDAVVSVGEGLPLVRLSLLIYWRKQFSLKSEHLDRVIQSVMDFFAPTCNLEREI